jgi:hypothetical protein
LISLGRGSLEAQDEEKALVGNKNIGGNDALFEALFEKKKLMMYQKYSDMILLSNES